MHLILFLSPALLLLTALISQATPSPKTDVYEKMIGSNADSFAVLRTTQEVVDSHYQKFYKHHLIIYKKEAHKEREGAIKKESETLILDFTKDTIHAPKVEITENVKNEEVSYASILSTFHEHFYVTVDEKLIKALKAPEDEATEKLVSNRLNALGGEGWKIAKVMQDSNCIYLLAKLGDDSAITCLLPNEVKELQERLAKKG